MTPITTVRFPTARCRPLATLFSLTALLATLSGCATQSAGTPEQNMPGVTAAPTNLVVPATPVDFTNPPGLQVNPPTPDPRVGLAPGMFDAEEAIWNLRLLSATPPEDAFVRGINSDLAFTGNYAIQGNFNGIQVWGHLRPGNPGFGGRPHLPGLTERRVGVQEPPLRIRGRLQRPAGLQRRRCPGRGEPRTTPRHPDLRHFRHRQPAVRRERADLPRLAHPHGPGAPRRRGQRLRLRVRIRAGAPGRGAARLLGGDAQR